MGEIIQKVKKFFKKLFGSDDTKALPSGSNGIQILIDPRVPNKPNPDNLQSHAVTRQNAPVQSTVASIPPQPRAQRIRRYTTGSYQPAIASIPQQAISTAQLQQSDLTNAREAFLESIRTAGQHDDRPPEQLSNNYANQQPQFGDNPEENLKKYNEQLSQIGATRVAQRKRPPKREEQDNGPEL